MEDKRKLIPVITSAINAYLQTEQPVVWAAPATEAAPPDIKPEPILKASQWKTLGRWKLTTVDRKLWR